MSILSGQNKKDFIIARREMEEDVDTITLMPLFLVVGAPDNTDVNEMKNILERSGEYDSTMWREYRVIPDGEWETQETWNHSIDHITDWAVTLRDKEDLLGCVHQSSAHGTTYDELVSRFHDEKRITLRLPWAMHVALNRAAKDQTLNSFCVEKLAEAIGYQELEEFESLRRKPGRPKKMQDSK